MDFLKLLKKRVIIFDGAMGTSLVDGRWSLVDSRIIPTPLPSGERVGVRGASSKLVCSEAYNLYAPEIVKGVHRSFVDAGCDVIETNTFNANRISLAEFGLEKEIVKITEKAVSVARNVADSVDRKVFVSGNVGPTSKLPSLGQISFDRLLEAYTEEIEVLVKSGVDLVQMDTCQDLLQAKIAVIACNDIFEKVGKSLPVVVSVTVDTSGRMLLGTELDAVLATLVPLGVSVVGLNCGLGPKGMESSVRYLSRHSPLPIAVLPNAGLPEIVDGETRYNLGPEEFADRVASFANELGVEMVGGCCGTTPEHISALVKKVIPVKKVISARKVISAKAGIHLESKDPRLRGDDICNLCRDDVRVWGDSLSSLFSSTVIRQEPAPLLIGERMNVNGSKKFKEKILAEDFDGAAQVATDQEREGSHALDISMSYAGRDEAADFCKILENVVVKTRLPISVDSTSPVVVEAALKKIPGRTIINSINLEDGGVKARKILDLAKRFGSAVVALTIDENGMARDEDEKVDIAGRLISLCGEYGIQPSSLLIDPLTFTLADPKAASYGSGARTLIAIKEIQKRFPDVGISLGVSNISSALRDLQERF